MKSVLLLYTRKGDSSRSSMTDSMARSFRHFSTTMPITRPRGQIPARTRSIPPVVRMTMAAMFTVTALRG